MDIPFTKLLLRNSFEGDDRNLCFVNAAIQVLRCIPEIKQNIQTYPFYSEVQIDLKNILDYEDSNQTVSASKLRKSLGRIFQKQQYFTGDQCDSLEFLEYLIQKTHPNIRSLFNFKIKTKREYFINGKLSGCQFCGVFPSISSEDDVVLKLSFPESNYENGISLQQLVNELFSGKFTEQKDGLRCAGCCNHEDSSSHDLRKCKPKPFFSTEKIEKHPKYLISQLLRFKRTETEWQKFGLLVRNSEKITIEQTDYELISVINHEGTFNQGHYTALIKSDNWYHCNDINNNIIRSENIISEKNYVFIFKQKENAPSHNTAETESTNETERISKPNKESPTLLHTIKEHQVNKDEFISEKNRCETSEAINGPIPIEILNQASFELKELAKTHNICGFFPPRRILNFREEDLNKYGMFDHSQKCINIHPLDKGHYVVSLKSIKDGTPKITIYDSGLPGSRMWSYRLKKLPEQLDFLYGKVKKENINVICAQQQGYNIYERNNGGLFALANAIMLVNDQDPRHYTLSKNMRSQLKNMHQNGVLQLTPFKTSQKENSVEISDSNLEDKEKIEDWKTPGKKRLKVVMKRLSENDEALNQISNKKQIKKLLLKYSVSNVKLNCHNRYSPLSQLKENCKENLNEKVSKRKEKYQAEENIKKKRKYESEGKEKRKIIYETGKKQKRYSNERKNQLQK